MPNAALRFKLSQRRKDETEEKEKGSGVWIIEDKKPKRIKVTTGISDGSYTELISGDIKEGQEVIVESLIEPKEKRTPSTRRGPRAF